MKPFLRSLQDWKSYFQVKSQQCLYSIIDPRELQNRKPGWKNAIFLNCLYFWFHICNCIMTLIIFGFIICFILIIFWNLGHNSPISFPTELFWWPQSLYFGGAGYPNPNPMQIAEIFHHCPKFDTLNQLKYHHFRYQEIQVEDISTSTSIRHPPRLILQDMPCLNLSHLDAGVCIAENTLKNINPTYMRCLPSFLVIGAQKAGSTDLRGLLSFHPYLDGPSSEVRFFAHLNHEKDLRQRWREYLDWFPQWKIPSPEKGVRDVKFEVHGKDIDKNVNLFKTIHGGGGGGTAAGAQWTYEKSPAYLGNKLAPKLVSAILPSVKIIAILREPSSRAYSAFQHNCRFKRWKLLQSNDHQRQLISSSSLMMIQEKEPLKFKRNLRTVSSNMNGTKEHKWSNMRSGKLKGNDPDVVRKLSLSSKEEEEGNTNNHHNEKQSKEMVISCDVKHDVKFKRSQGKSVEEEPQTGGQCDDAKLLLYPCQSNDFHLLLLQQNYHLILSKYDNEKKLILNKHDENEKKKKLKLLMSYMNDINIKKSDAGSLISKGLYSYHLRDWLNYFPKHQIKIILFEEFYKQGVSSSIHGVTDFLGVPFHDIELVKGLAIYTWYNGAQRARNHYDPMTAQSKELLQRLFCDPNQDLKGLLSELGVSLETRHGYACV